MLGGTPESLSHVLLKTIWQSPSVNDLITPSIRVYETGERCTLDPIRLEFRPGISRWYSVKIAKIQDGMAWTVSDVTERETMRQEILAQRDSLEQANQRLTALDREKSEMLGIAAHDLRSPIGNIRSLCELISSDDPSVTEITNMIQYSSDSLLNLIENLLDVERIEQGKIELEMQPVDVSFLLDHAIDQFSAEASQKEIQIHLSGPRITAMADESAIARVIQNLLSNAIKFSPPGKPVAIHTSIREGRLRVEIEDNGPGISENDRKKLFVKFAKLSARPTAGESSTGLGLSIAKSLVEAMRGEIGCDSIPGQGATFWFELALVKDPYSA